MSFLLVLIRNCAFRVWNCLRGSELLLCDGCYASVIFYMGLLVFFDRRHNWRGQFVAHRLSTRLIVVGSQRQDPEIRVIYL